MDIVNTTSNLNLKDDPNIYHKCFFAYCFKVLLSICFFTTIVCLQQLLKTIIVNHFKVELMKFVCNNITRGSWEISRQHKGNANA
jgi:hypothetical protein